MGKQLTEELKKQISELYRNSDMTNFEIAKTLGVSSRSVRRYKNYGYQEPSVQPESYNQEIEQENHDYEIEIQEELDEIEQDIETSEDNEPSEKKIIEYRDILKCPDCDAPKSEWLTIDQALEQGYNIDEISQYFYDYVCPKCRRLIPEKRPDVSGVCPNPECHATSIDWFPIEEAPISDEEKEYYDLFCMGCFEPGGFLGIGKHIQCIKAS